MTHKMINVPCEVCGGFGGWYERTLVGTAYYDCPLCEGYGFYAKNLEEDALSLQHMMKFDHYKEAINHELRFMGMVENFYYEDGKVMIDFQPDSDSEWSHIAKRLLKMAHFHNGLEVTISHKHYFNGEEKRFRRCWVIEIIPDDIRDLEGIVTVLRDWNLDRDNRYEKYDKRGR